MLSQSFIDVVFPQFAPHIWRLGTSIYRSGAILNFSSYKDLVSAKVKAGIGEIYEVRLKLHSQGKCVQWMECTCKANRRHNEKCSHLVAFCIYLDQEQQKILTKMNMNSGDSDKYLFGERYASSVESGEPPLQNPDVIVTSIPKNVLKSLETQSQEPDSPGWLKELSQVVLTDISEHEPLLLVTAQVRDKKNLTYCLGIDDAIVALKQKEIYSCFSAKMSKIQVESHLAVRFFDVRVTPSHGVKICRSFEIKAGTGKPSIIFPADKFLQAQIGRKGFFAKNFGYVAFVDELNDIQISRWNEYPVNAFLEGDNAALLFEAQFQRLYDTAEVRLAKELSELSIVKKVKFDALRLKTAKDGKIIVEATAENSGELMSIIKARAEGKKFLSTKNGWIKLSDELDWLKDKIKSDGNLELSSIEFIKFREQFASESELIVSDPVSERLKTGLVSTKDIVFDPLVETNLTLRNYQEDGLKWLWWLYQNGLSGLLADEMGLGKTHQAMGLMSLIAREEPNSFSLIVCPTTVIDHWLDKLKRFTPSLNVVCYHGSGRRLDSLTADGQHKVIITSYGIMLRDVDIFALKPWALVLLDEAHLVKNQSTRTYKAAFKIPSKMRLCLTGTPLENDLMELKNLFDYILPHYLGTDAEFKRKYLKENTQDMMASLDLHRVIHPFKMRRHKMEVLSDLPEKVEDLRYCHLNKLQHKLYVEALSLKGEALIANLRQDSGPIPYVHVFSVIALLKQICDDPALIDPRYEDIGSGKLDLLDELIDEAMASDQKVVVFSQYAKMVARLSQRLTRKGIEHSVLTGATQKRGEVVRCFQENSNKKVFLGSLLAGGTGIDLTAANIVIHFDRWWNAAKENQATDRVHRIGQIRNVQVYKLVTRGTLEERINDIINRKRSIFDRFVEQDADIFKHLTREDLLNLLAVPENISAAPGEFDATRDYLEY